MKLSDYVIDFFSKLDIDYSFVVTGGADLHLINSIADHPKMQHICVQHEQFGGAAADGYSRASQKLGLALTTSGPGATNLLTSICSAYFDSIPMVCLTGQVSRFRLRPNNQLRQKGFQETDISAIFKDITKYVTLITDPLMIRYELEKAVYLAQEGRPGPVVLDIPDDLQREEINIQDLKSFVPEKKHIIDFSKEINELISYIRNSKMPILIIGAGVHSSKAEKEVIQFARHFNIPVLLAWGAADLFAEDDPLNMGRLGVCGPRAGNFAVQQADLIIALGTRLSQMITGGKQELFAPKAKKVVIDIDQEELNKFGYDSFHLNLPILADLKEFFLECKKSYLFDEKDLFSNWRKKIFNWKQRYLICPPEYYQNKNSVNPYVFIKHLSKTANEGDIFFTDTGANLCWVMQTFEFKKNQRIFSAWNNTPMGYALPASIGAFWGVKKDIYCLIGDGGLMMCLQELATICRYNIPIKIFLFDNKGYTTVKQTIDFWLNSRYVAVDEESGLSFPDYQKLAESFHIPYVFIKDHSDLSKIDNIYSMKGPCFCHLNIDEKQRIVPLLKYGSGIEDLFPKLPEDEIEGIMQEYRTLLENKEIFAGSK